MSKMEILDSEKIREYQKGGEGFIKFVEENVKFKVPQRDSPVVKWVYPPDLPSKPDPVTGKSFKTFWENQKDVLREALKMENDKFVYRVVVLCWSRGEGKCQEKGSKVLMYNGTVKNVEDVVVGDLLMGDDNTPRKVLSLVNGSEEMFEVVPMRGEPLVVTGDHILSLRRRRRGVRIRDRPDKKAGKIIDISVNDYQKQSNYFKDMTLLLRTPIDWPEQEVPIDPYFLGLWLGDGHSHLPAITTMDQEVVAYIYRVAEELGLRVSCREKKNNKASSYFIVGEYGLGISGTNCLLDLFRENNLLYNKHIPQVYKANSREVRLKILAGLVDSDGYRNRNSIQFSFKSKVLADDVLFLARSLGFHAEVQKCTKTIKNTDFSGEYYRIGISGDCSIIPTKIPRKNCPIRSNWKDVLVTTIKEIKSVGIREYYGFTLDGNGRYVTGDFTVTHNSFNVCLIQLWKFFCFPRQLIVLGALSKDQTRFVHYEMMQDIILNSPKLLNVIGKRNVQQGQLSLKNSKGEVVSSIRPISSYTGIVSNITGYTFSEMFGLKNNKFFVELDGSTRNIFNALGTIDSTVSDKEHILYTGLYKPATDGSDKLTFFHHRSAPNALPEEFWHPHMDKDQINSYRNKFPPADFDRYFRNVWELQSGKLFTEPMINSIFYLGSYEDEEKKVFTLDKENRVFEICNEIQEIQIKSDNKDGRKNKSARKRRRKTAEKEKAKTVEKIDFLKTKLYPTDNIYQLHSSFLPRPAPINDLKRLGELYDTNWGIHAGIDRSDPLAKNPLARTIVTVVAKGLTGSRTNTNIEFKDPDVPEYIYFLLHLAHVTDATLEGIKTELKEAYKQYDGIDTLCSERWGAWDLAPWCEENEINFEAIFPTYQLQKQVFTELYLAIRHGRFKSPEIIVPGSKTGNILEEELKMFDYHPHSKWYGSPQKYEPDGVQDDAVFSLGLGVFGGRNYGIHDFRERQTSSHFGVFIPGGNHFATYNLED